MKKLPIYIGIAALAFAVYSFNISQKNAAKNNKVIKLLLEDIRGQLKNMEYEYSQLETLGSHQKENFVSNSERLIDKIESFDSNDLTSDLYKQVKDFKVSVIDRFKLETSIKYENGSGTMISPETKKILERTQRKFDFENNHSNNKRNHNRWK